jgi:hypothetical protein
MLGGLFFFWVLDPFTLGEVTFSFFIRFRQLLVCQMRQEERFKFSLDTKHNGALPLDPACPEHLNAQSPAQFTLLHVEPEPRQF